MAAQCARLRELDEAPFAVEPVLGEDQDDSLGAAQLAIKLALPSRARLDACVLVEIEKRIGETARSQPREQALRLTLVMTRMAYEDSRHPPHLDPSTGLR
jgi:hypothetical protein